MLPHGIRKTSPPHFLASVAAFVRARRKANRLTQGDLALLAGVGRRLVSELENGKPTLQIDKVDAVVRVFGKRLGLVEQERPRDREQPAHTEHPTPHASETRELRRAKGKRHA